MSCLQRSPFCEAGAREASQASLLPQPQVNPDAFFLCSIEYFNMLYMHRSRTKSHSRLNVWRILARPQHARPLVAARSSFSLVGLPACLCLCLCLYLYLCQV